MKPEGISITTDVQIAMQKQNKYKKTKQYDLSKSVQPVKKTESENTEMVEMPRIQKSNFRNDQ